MLSNCMWYNYAEALQTELMQSRDEGKDVGAMEEIVKGAGLSQSFTLDEQQRMGEILDMFAKLEQSEGAQYNEPSGWEEIQALQTPRTVVSDIQSRSELGRKIQGAWFGRVCGCLLGKPVEGWLQDSIKKIAAADNNYPITRYLHGNIPTLEYDAFVSKERIACSCFIEKINGYAVADDDTNYTVLALKLLDKYGRDFTSLDVAELWMASFPVLSLCTAEHAAYRNMVNHILPPQSAVYRNPYREWIGAQIRGDFFGYINPGNPFAAAEMAYRDACVTHVKNGIYGEMFVAAMIAQAAVINDIQEIIKAGLDTIPYTSRLHEAITRVLDRKKKGADFQEVIDWIYDCFPPVCMHNTVHTIPNAMMVAAALLYGENDFSKTLGLSVAAGMDTDCNGATVGSIIGMTAFDHIPEHWISPLGNLLETDVQGYNKVKISELAEKTMQFIPD